MSKPALHSGGGKYVATGILILNPALQAVFEMCIVHLTIRSAAATYDAIAEHHSAFMFHLGPQ